MLIKVKQKYYEYLSSWILSFALSIGLRLFFSNIMHADMLSHMGFFGLTFCR